METWERVKRVRAKRRKVRTEGLDGRVLVSANGTYLIRGTEVRVGYTHVEASGATYMQPAS